MSEEGLEAEPLGNGLVRGLAHLRVFAAGHLVPPAAQLEAVLADANDLETLTGLQKLVSAHEEVAKKCNLVFEESVRLAVFRLDVERKLGTRLAQVVQWGGDRARSTRLTLLPEGVTKQMAAKYRTLAAISEGTFRGYLEHAREAEVIPSANGARAFDRQERMPGRKRVRTKQRCTQRVELSLAVVDALRRFFGSVDVRVGDANVPATVALKPGNADARHLRGSVLFAECRGPDVWLHELANLRRAARIDEAVVFLPADTAAEWFRRLADGWSCCFVAGKRASLVAYHGPRARLFEVALRDLGVVMAAPTC